MRARAWLFYGVGPWVRLLHFSQFIDRYVAGLRHPAVLDAGCGTGEHLAWLARRVPEARLVGIDSSLGATYAKNAERARRHLRGTAVDFRVGDLKRLDASEEFDVVYSIDVLEHIPGNALVMQNLFRALKPGGLFYLAMPYDRERSSILPRRFMRGFRAWADEEHIGEMRSLHETEQVLESIGFRVLESRYTFGQAARAAWEMQQLIRSLPGGRLTDRLAAPILNSVASLDVRGRGPADGNVVVVCRKP